jgi:predicted Fe-Mo cluster-binding NifX family protein
MSYKIALTSSNGRQIDLHFGHTDEFQIIHVDDISGIWEILEPRKLIIKELVTGGNCSGDGCTGHGHNDVRLNAVIQILSDCRYILTARIGPKPQAVLQQAGITVLESPENIAIAIPKLHAYHLKYAKKNQGK